jgi:hypothetical protein
MAAAFACIKESAGHRSEVQTFFENTILRDHFCFVFCFLYRGLFFHEFMMVLRYVTLIYFFLPFKAFTKFAEKYAATKNEVFSL